MTTAAVSPFRQSVPLSDVPAGRVLSTDDGESRQVYEIAGHSGWLAKLYRTPVPVAASGRLEKLIGLPERMSAADRTLAGEAVAWPVARIVDGGAVQGIVMAKAPDRFSARLRKFSGEPQDPAPLPLDWLVQSDEACRKRGIEPAGRAVREHAVRRLLAVADLFARHDIVYGDWSYSNVFWEQGTGAVFVIDMDTCGIGTRPWIQSNGWEDPLFSEQAKPPLTVLSDRYKVAVLTTRCLTGERGDPLAAHGTLVAGTGTTPLSAALRLTLTARAAASRCTPRELLAALDGRTAPARPQAGGPAPTANRPNPGNVTGSVRVGSPPRTPPAAQNGSGANVAGRVDLTGRRPGTSQPARPTPQPAPPAPQPAPSAPQPAAQPAAPAPVPAPAPTPARQPVSTTATVLGCLLTLLVLAAVLTGAALLSTLLFGWPL